MMQHLYLQKSCFPLFLLDLFSTPGPQTYSDVMFMQLTIQIEQNSCCFRPGQQEVRPLIIRSWCCGLCSPFPQVTLDHLNTHVPCKIQRTNTKVHTALLDPQNNCLQRSGVRLRDFSLGSMRRLAEKKEKKNSVSGRCQRRGSQGETANRLPSTHFYIGSSFELQVYGMEAAFCASTTGICDSEIQKSI